MTQLTECKHCFNPATAGGNCPYHGGKPIRQIIREKKITPGSLRRYDGYLGPHH